MPNSTGSAPARLRMPIATAIAALACAGVLATATPALAASQAAQEGVVVFEGQLNGHQVKAVVLHTRAHSFRVTLRNGRKVSVAFPASEQQRLLEEVEAHGVAVKVAKAQPPSHTRRYVAIGVAVVLVIALAAGAWLFMRRRRIREEEEGPRVR